MHAVAEWFATVTQGKIPGELAVMLISMVPLLELRGGMIVAKLLDLDYWKAVTLLCNRKHYSDSLHPFIYQTDFQMDEEI